MPSSINNPYALKWHLLQAGQSECDANGTSCCASQDTMTKRVKDRLHARLRVRHGLNRVEIEHTS